MASYERRVVSTIRVEFVVPAGEPRGANWVEVMKAVSSAAVELRQLGLLGEDREPDDDMIRIRPEDDAVIVFYEREGNHA